MTKSYVCTVRRVLIEVNQWCFAPALCRGGRRSDLPERRHDPHLQTGASDYLM